MEKLLQICDRLFNGSSVPKLDLMNLKAKASEVSTAGIKCIIAPALSGKSHATNKFRHLYVDIDEIVDWMHYQFDWHKRLKNECYRRGEWDALLCLEGIAFRTWFAKFPNYDKYYFTQTFSQVIEFECYEYVAVLIPEEVYNKRTLNCNVAKRVACAHMNRERLKSDIYHMDIPWFIDVDCAYTFLHLFGINGIDDARPERRWQRFGTWPDFVGRIDVRLTPFSSYPFLFGTQEPVAVLGKTWCFKTYIKNFQFNRIIYDRTGVLLRINDMCYDVKVDWSNFTIMVPEPRPEFYHEDGMATLHFYTL
jgi:hypothetical protein